eukprot:9751445-Lingulodinium_polyedra.AAC.1
MGGNLCVGRWSLRVATRRSPTTRPAAGIDVVVVACPRLPGLTVRPGAAAQPVVRAGRRLSTGPRSVRSPPRAP